MLTQTKNEFFESLAEFACAYVYLMDDALFGVLVSLLVQRIQIENAWLQQQPEGADKDRTRCVKCFSVIQAIAECSGVNRREDLEQMCMPLFISFASPTEIEYDDDVI